MLLHGVQEGKMELACVGSYMRFEALAMFLASLPPFPCLHLQNAESNVAHLIGMLTGLTSL